MVNFTHAVNLPKILSAQTVLACIIRANNNTSMCFAMKDVAVYYI